MKEKLKFFGAHKFEKKVFLEACEEYDDIEIEFIEAGLDSKTADLAKGVRVVCSFVSDKVDEACIAKLKEAGVELIVLRSAGFNHVDLAAAQKNQIQVARVPAYSPNAIAEFTVGLVLTLSRKIHKAYHRVRDLNFSLDDLVGVNLCDKTVGVVGAGKIGRVFVKIMAAFGCEVLICDLSKDSELEDAPNISYVDLETLCKKSDIISLHLPLTPETHHIIDHGRIALMKDGVMLVNTGRGALIDSSALIHGLKKKKIGAAALDVYEEEESVFFHDLSNTFLEDDILARLLTFPNVLITSHQAFLTTEALREIARVSLDSMEAFINKKPIPEQRLVSARNISD